MAAQPVAREGAASGEALDLRELEDATLIDAVGADSAYLLPRPNGAYIRLSPNAYHLLRLRSSGVSSETIAARLQERGERGVEAHDVETAYERILRRIREIDDSARPTFFGLWFRATVIPASVVRTIAGLLTVAYRRPVVYVGLTLAALAAWRAATYGYPVNPATAEFWMAYALFVTSLLAHEFGHASACAYFGARPADIGAAVYLIYPAFYSDVSDAWRLRRSERVAVDLGGIYFQLQFGVLLVLAYELTAWEPLKLSFLFVIVGCAFSLNPVFRMDGYWVIADATGVLRLSREARRIARYARDRLLGRRPPALPWSAGVTAVMSAYAIISFGGWIVALGIFLPVVWRHHLSTYPADAANFFRDLVVAPHAVGAERVGEFLSSSFFVLITLFALSRLAHRLRGLRRPLRPSDDGATEEALP